MSSIECAWPANAILGEAPFWSVDEGVLYWVDIDGKTVFRYRPENAAKEAFVLDHEIGCIIPRRKGGFVAGLDCGLAFFSPDLSKAEVFAAPEDAVPETRFNDGKCDRSGRLWVASADRNETEPLASLYSLSTSGQLTRVLSRVTVGNGIGWSPDNRTMYFTDTGIGTIFSFDYEIETGATGNGRVFVEVDERDGLPDGLTVDAEGYVWSAHWAGSRITRYDPKGGVERVIDMPVPNVTSLTFGGPDLCTLFVTTARLGMSDQELETAPLSGGLFVVDVDVGGILEFKYAG